MATPLHPIQRLAAHKAGSTVALDWTPRLLSIIARERSDGAFRRVFEKFRPKLRSYMTREGVDFATAEDLAQETLLTVWCKAGMYSSEKGTPETWMLTIARNLRIDRLRREPAVQALSDELSESVPSEDPPPEDAMSGRQRETRVQRVLADLPQDQRTVVMLAFVEGLTHSEIAAQLSLPLGTVKSRLRLAYEKVRDALKDLK